MPLQPFRRLGGVDLNLQGIGAIQNIQKTKQNELINLANQANIDEFGLNAPVREAARGGALDAATLKSIEAGAIQAFPFIQAGDDAGLTRNIQQRRQALIEQGRSTQETDEIFGMLNSGDQGQIDQAKQIITAIATQGQTAAKPDAATLSPGQSRFVGGVETASVPAAPEKPTDRKTAKAADGFLRFQDTGEKVFPDVDKAPDEGQTRDQRAIASGIRQGLTQAQSENLVFGRTRQEINDNTGQIVKIEDIAGKATEIDVGGGTDETPAPPPGQTLRDLSGSATGPVSSFTAKTAAALSFFGINPDEASTGAQQTFRTHTQSLIRALAINPRFPVAEMERIKEEISIQPAFFQGEGTLIKKIDSLDASLRLRLNQAERDFNDPGLDVKTRQAQGANASALKNFLVILGGNPQADEVTSRIEAIESRLEELRSGN